MTANANVPTAALKKLDFGYDYRARRITKKVSTWTGSNYVAQSTIKFLYDDWNLVAEVNNTNSVLRSYSWGLDLSGTAQGAGGVGGLVAANITTNGVHFCAYDGNGNVRGLICTTNGTITGNYEYGPFGETIRAEGAAANSNPCRFSTKFTDDESDFLYYGYRYYPPSTGRWISRDSINEKGGINLLAFVRNDPVRNLDVFGLKCRVALRCDGVVRSGLRLGTHCGLVIETDDGVKDFDGSGGDENIRGLAAGTAGDATGPWTDLPASVCACIFANIDSWNQRHVPRDHSCANSNWNLKCLTKKCKIDINWGSQEKPIGYDCRECVYETLPRGDRDVKCCTSTREKPCPDE